MLTILNLNISGFENSVDPGQLTSKIRTHTFPLYSKTCVKRLLKIDKTNVFMTNGSLMKVESIAECPPPLVLKTNLWSFWEWPFYTGFTVLVNTC